MNKLLITLCTLFLFQNISAKNFFHDDGFETTNLFFFENENPSNDSKNTINSFLTFQNVFDDFSNTSYSNNSGSVSWSSDWTEVSNLSSASDPDGATSGYIRVTSERLRLAGISGTDPYIYREVDLSTSISAKLTFDISTSLTLEETGNIDKSQVQISNNGGSTWVVLETFNGDVSGSKSYDIQSYAAANTQIRFNTSSYLNGSGEYVYFDNIKVEFEDSQGGPGCANCINPTEIGGFVFTDVDNDGINNSEIRVENVTVYLYDDDGQVGSSITTDSKGEYLFFGLDANVTYRVEFTVPSGMKEGALGIDSKSTVQFAQPGTCNLNFGIFYSEDYCVGDPDFFGVCFVGGEPLGNGDSGDKDVIVSAAYSATGTNSSQINDLTINKQTGTVWGLAFQKTTETLFSAAFMKRHAGFGPLGLGGIYAVDYSDPSNATVSNWLDVNTLSGVNVGANPRSYALPADVSESSYDPDGFDPVGKIGLGDIDISDDQETLYAMNLNNNGSLLAIDIATKTLINEISVPNPGCGSNADVRPFGLKVYRGEVYVGLVCSGENAGLSDMHFFILKLNGNSFVTVTDGDLNYTKGFVHASYANPPTVCSDWEPWISDFSDLHQAGASTAGPRMCRPQPMLSDIEFDDAGSMILGFMDRTGHQTGYLQKSTTTSDTQNYNGYSGGDLLKIYNNNGTFVLENNGTTIGGGGCGANGEGPGTGEFYCGEYFSTIHEETSHGGLGIRPGQDEVMVSIMDPLNVWSGGVSWMSNSSGLKNDNLQVFQTTAGAAGTFGKAAGMGDIEIACPLAPIEIGNYVWWDDDLDGLMDATEPGIANIPLELWLDPDGNTQGNNVGNGDEILVATTTTNANGQYVFSFNGNSNGLNTEDWSYTSNSMVLTNTTYQLKIPNWDGSGSGGASSILQSFKTTQGYIASDPLLISPTQTQSNINDSNGFNNNGFSLASVLTGGPGENDHNFDFGFGANCTMPTATISVTDATCSGANSNNNATLILSAITGGDKVNWIAGNDYVNSGGNIDYQNATTIGALPFTIKSGLQNPSTSQNYTVRVFNGASECFSDYVVTINEVICCNVEASVNNPTACDGNTITVTATGTGGDGNYSYNWSVPMGANAPGDVASFSTTISGNYAVTISDGNNCTDTANGTVSIFTNPTATASATDATCMAGTTIINSDGTITIDGFTAGEKYDYTIGSTYTGNATFTSGSTTIPSNGIIENSLSSPATAANYTIRIFNDNECFVDRTVTLNPTSCDCINPIITALTNEAICLNESFTTANITTSVTNSISVTYQWFDNNGANNSGNGIISGQTTATLTALPISIGNYSYKVIATNTADGSCFAEQIVDLIINGLPVAGISSLNESCPELNNGSATASGSVGSGGYTYVWAHGPTSAGVSGLSIGNYTVTVLDSNGCQDVETTTITELDTLKSTIVSTNPTCGLANGSGSVSGSGGSPSYSYLWTDGEVANNITNKSAGTYKVTITDANLCTLIDSIVLINQGSPNTGFVNYTGCEGDGYSIMVEGSLYDENNRTGTETVSGGNVDGCDSIITINLIFNTPPVLAATDSIICNGSSVDLIGLFSTTAGTITYHSATPPTIGNQLSNMMVTPAIPTTYYAMATDANNCSNIISATVTPDSPDASIIYVTETSGIENDTVVCHGGVINFGSSITFESGTGNYTYQWLATPADSVVFSSTADGLFETGTFSNRSAIPLNVNLKFLVTDENGCQDSVDFNATVQPLLQIDSIQKFDNSGSIQDQGVCFGDSIGFKVHPSPAGNYTYNWDSGQTTDSITVKPPYNNSNTVYNVTVTDAYGCEASTFTSAKGFSEMIADVSFLQGCSNGDSDTLIYNVVGGIPSAMGYFFDISTEALQISSFSPVKVPINQPAGTIITTVINDEKGCGPTLQITVPTVTYLSTAATASSATCINGTSSANSDGAITLTGFTAGEKYDYNIGNTYSGNASFLAATIIPANGIIVNNLPNPTVDTEYTIRIFAANGCYLDRTVTLIPTVCNCTNPIITALTNESICLNESFTQANVATSVTNSVSVYYQWFDNDGTANLGTSPIAGQTTNTFNVLPTAAGDYSYKVVATNILDATCTAEQTVDLIINDLPSVSLNSPGVCAGDSSNIIASASGGSGLYTYVWSVPTGVTAPGDINMFSTSQAGNYVVTITDSNGCTATSSGVATANPNPICSIDGPSILIENTPDKTYTAPTGMTTYLWSISSGDAQIDGANNIQSITLDFGATTSVLELTITDSNGCSATCSQTIVTGEFDLALRKDLGANQLDSVKLGDDVDYIITVFNEGDITASEIKVCDVVPNGMMVSPVDTNGWDTSNPDTVYFSIPTTLAPNDSIKLNIKMRLIFAGAECDLINIAEIVAAKDEEGTLITDIDSTPDNGTLTEDDIEYEKVILLDHDPTGWIYCDKTGKVVMGGTISITGPNGIPDDEVNIVHNGINGYYEWYAVGTPGIYTISYSHPDGFPLSVLRLPMTPALDPTGLGTEVTLGVDTLTGGEYISDTTFANNPYYLQFDFELGDPPIFLNNIPVRCAFIGAIACLDQNMNDQNDGTEPGFPDVKIRIYDCADLVNPLDSTFSDANGSYNFDGLTPGNYALQFVQPENYRFLTSQADTLINGFTSCTSLNWGDCDTSKIACFTLTRYDWGDLPDATPGFGIGNYVTQAANNGPSHLIINGLHLGSAIDEETNGQQSIDAFGDGADEDAIIIPSYLNVIPGGFFTLPISSVNTTNKTAHLEAWIDWNGDGDFDDANELVMDMDDSGADFPTSVTLNVPTDAVQGQLVGYRIRISHSDDMTPYGEMSSGEVEDYLIGIMCKQPVCLPVQYNR